MAVVIETWAGEDLELGIGDTVKTHPAGGFLNCHQISLSTFSLAGASGSAITTGWPTELKNIPHLSQLQVNVSVPGAAFGDMVLASLTTQGTAGLSLSANVSAANQVTVVLSNMSGTTINPVPVAAGYLRLLVFKIR
jgi:hypothetical protein